MERRVAYPRADLQHAVALGQKVEPGDPVDVDQVRRARQAERHDRRQALSAGQHQSVARRQLGEQLHRVGQSLRAVIGERRRFQLPALPADAGLAPARLTA